MGRLATRWLLDPTLVASEIIGICITAAVSLGLLAAGALFGTAPPSAVRFELVTGAEFDVLGFLIPRYFGRQSFGVIYAAIF